MQVKEQEQLQKSFSLKTWKKILPFIQPYYKMVFAILVLMLFNSLLDVAMPLFQKEAIDSFIEKNTTDNITLYALCYAAVVVVQMTLVIIFTRCAMIVETKVGRDMREKLFVHLQKMSISYYNFTPVGYIMARVLNDSSRIGGMIAWSLVDMFWAIAYIIMVFISMMVLNPVLALIVMTIVPLMAIVTVLFQRKILTANRLVRKVNSFMTGKFNEGIVGARTSKTLVIEQKNMTEFSGVTNEMYGVSMRAAKLNARFIPIIMFLTSTITAVILWRGGFLAQEQLIEIGTLSAFLSYATGIFDPIQTLARIMADFISVQANIERVTDLLAIDPSITDRKEVEEKYGDLFEPKQEHWEEIKGDIEFRDVSFHYPDSTDEVLSHFNLKVPAGTTVAIVGETGAGKSTMVNLVCRFFEPTGGQILIDGKDYRERSQLWLHSNIGCVLQQPHLFSGTLADNIRYGKLDATEEEMHRAAKLVSADQIAAKLEDGYNSFVGEGGDRLSTGEKQLVSFARAIVANPRIFVLDEATSSIDANTEQLIQRAISYLLEGRTSFIIAHRLSTIRQADIILVVKDGKIVEQGSHRQLMDRKGYYHSLYNKQFA